MTAIDERVVVSELDERMRPELLDGTDFRDRLLDRLDLVARRQKNRRCAELTAPGTPARGLGGEAVIALDLEEVEAWHRSLCQIPFASRRTVNAAQLTRLGVTQDICPDDLSLPSHDRIEVLCGFLRKRGGMQSANDRAHPHSPIARGKSVSLLDLGRECGDGSDVARRQLRDLANVLDFVIRDLESIRGHPGQCQQTETG